MGNINNIWYLNDSGGDWASTKCELDDCYSIPFDPAQDDSLYLQVAIPGNYLADEVWLCSPDGDRLQELLSMTEYKRITGENNLLIFKMPQNSMACRGMMEDGCFVDLLNDHPDPFIQQIVQDWVNGVNNTQLHFQYMSVLYPMGTPGSNAALPPGFSWLNGHTIIAPCGIDFVSNGTFIYYTSDIFPAGGGFTFGYRVQRGLIPSNDKLNCWYLEIPLHLPESSELATLRSEPFHCPDCQPTLKISSDYCLAATDIFGTFIFNTFAIEGTKTGSLEKAKNDFRIQAVLKQLPSKVSANRNVRCNNFKSTLQQRYKLQGAMPTDFPDYMVNIIESIFSGKKVYIEGEEYIVDGDVLFTERSVAGRSMKKLDVELVKCERGLIFECKCVVDCDEGAPSRSFLIIPASNLNTSGNMQYGIGREYTYASVSVSGPYPPYTISGWATGGDCLPTDDIVGHEFDDSRSYNIFKRQVVHFIGFPFGCTCAGNPGCGCNPEEYTSIICQVTDSRGCRYQAGLTVEREDLRCSGYGAYFDASSPALGQIKISNILPGTWSHYSIVINGTTVITGITTDPYTVTGLTPGQEHEVFIVLYCSDGTQGRIGPRFVTP